VISEISMLASVTVMSISVQDGLDD
jgi:hypothetical protein